MITVSKNPLPIETRRSIDGEGPLRLDYQGHDYKPARGAFDSVGRLTLSCLLTGIAYFFATKIAFVLCLPDSKVSLVFPPYALLITVLLFVPVRHWWTYVLSAMCGHHVVTWQSHWPTLYALHCELFDTVQIVCAAGGIHILTKAPLKFATLREVFAVIAVAAIVMPCFTSFWGAAFTVSNGYGTHYWIEWRNLVLSNAATAIALLPAFIIIAGNAKNWRKIIGWKRLLEGIVLAAGLLATGILVFASQPVGGDTSPGLICAPLPFLVWASLRFGPGGTSASLMLGWVLAIWGAMHGRGPFLAHSPTQNTLSLQYFFLVISVPLTFLAVVIKEAENSQTEVRENEAQFRAMTHSAPVMIWKSDTDKRFTFFNQGWLDFTGRTLKQEQGNGWTEGVHPDDYDRCLQIYVRSFEARQDFTMEYRLRRNDGEYRWVLDSGVPRFDPYGTFQGYIGSCVDISDRKRAELELQQHRSELAHLSRVTMMGELSGSMAHELNQPLTAILSNAQAALRYLAHDSADLDEVRGILKDIVDEDKRAGEVIRRLRLLFKKGEVQFQPLDLNETIEDVLRLLHSDLVNHNVVVDVKLSERLPAVSGDRVQLQQVLINLIVNGCDAMGDTPYLERRLSVRTEWGSGEDVRVAVGDHGCGIAPDHLERVFEPFVTTKQKGMGLGLAVCRTIITAHGGRLWAENNPDGGACFVFSLPTQKEIR